MSVLAGGAALLIQRDNTRTAACDEVNRLEDANASRRASAIDPSKPLIAFLGDSYTQGQKMDDPLDAFPYIAAEIAGDSALVNGRGGSGFVFDGPCADQAFSYRIDSVLSHDFDVLVVQGGVNDLGRSGQDRAARDLLAAVRTHRPNTTVLLVGPAAAPGVSRSEVDATAEGMSRAAETAEASFIDLRDLSIDFLPDGVHPTITGHETIGEAVAKVLLDQ